MYFWHECQKVSPFEVQGLWNNFKAPTAKLSSICTVLRTQWLQEEMEDRNIFLFCDSVTRRGKNFCLGSRVPPAFPQSRKGSFSPKLSSTSQSCSQRPDLSAGSGSPLSRGQSSLCRQQCRGREQGRSRVGWAAPEQCWHSRHGLFLEQQWCCKCSWHFWGALPGEKNKGTAIAVPWTP